MTRMRRGMNTLTLKMPESVGVLTFRWMGVYRHGEVGSMAVLGFGESGIEEVD